MQQNRVTEVQQLWGDWISLLNRLLDDPKVSQVMNSRIGQYLSSHPVLALIVLLFSALAALPAGLFLTFALVTSVMCAVGFVFIEGFLLSVGGLFLMCALFGIAVFSVFVSLIFKLFYIIISNVLKYNYQNLTQQGNVQEKGSETSSEETQ